MANSEPLAKLSWMLTLASIAIVIGGLYLAKERSRLGRIPAVLITAMLAFTLLGVVSWMAVVQMTNLTRIQTASFSTRTISRPTRNSCCIERRASI